MVHSKVELLCKRYTTELGCKENGAPNLGSDFLILSEKENLGARLFMFFISACTFVVADVSCTSVHTFLSRYDLHLIIPLGIHLSSCPLTPFSCPLFNCLAKLLK